MSVYTTMTQLATILRQLSSSGDPLTANQLRTVYDVIPRVVQDADLPGIVIIPDSATYDTDTDGDQMVIETRVYNLDYIYSRADVGTAGESQGAIEPVFTIIRDFLLARPGLWDTQATLPGTVTFNSTLLGDSGYTDIAYASGKYVGIRYRLQVREVAPITYVD